MVELFSLNTPDCISSLERKPFPGRNVVYEEPILFDELNNEYNNQIVKWSNRGAIGFFKTANNITADPENLTTTNWSIQYTGSISLTDYYFNNHRFSKISTNGTRTTDRAEQVNNVYGSIPSITATFKKGNGASSGLYLYNNTATAYILTITIDWSAKTVSQGSYGTLIYYHWHSDDIVTVSGTANSITSGNEIRIQIATNGDSSSVHYCYATAIHLENSAYPTPYTPTSRDTSELAYPFEWSQQGIIECWVRPWFTYNTSNEKWIASNYNSDYTPNYNIALLYESSEDKWRAVFWDGSTKIDLYSSQITSNTQLWKWWHMKITWDTINDDYHFYIDGVSVGDTTATLTTIDFNNNIFIGSIPKYTSPDNFTFNGFITDLLYKDYVDTSTEHYEKNIPYINRMETLGKNNLWKIM